MANKVISIKMDEKDIERIKKYYETLAKAGYLSTEKVSMNAFYKHLLLDYLEHDFCEALAVHSKYTMSPVRVNPDNCELNNTYNLSTETFEIYKECVKEIMYEKLNEMDENATRFNELLKMNVFVKKGFLHELCCDSWEDSDEKATSFWESEVLESYRLAEESYTKEDEMGSISEMIKIVEKSSVSMESKEKLINELLRHKKQLQQNRIMIQGGRLMK